VRARLGKMTRGHEFQFVCADDMAGKMDRVVQINGGVIRSKRAGRGWDSYYGYEGRMTTSFCKKSCVVSPFAK